MNRFAGCEKKEKLKKNFWKFCLQFFLLEKVFSEKVSQSLRVFELEQKSFDLYQIFLKGHPTKSVSLEKGFRRSHDRNVF